MKTFIVAVLCVMMAACSPDRPMSVQQTLMCDGKATLVKPAEAYMSFDEGTYEVRDARWSILGSYTPARGALCQLQ